MESSKKKLAVISLGKRNSGKSSTWYEIFGRVIRTGWKKLSFTKDEITLFVKNSSFEETGTEIDEDIFIRNASFEEYGDEIIDYFSEKKLPNVIFCAVQYVEHGIQTINWFKEHDYYLYIQWLNPGYSDSCEYSDFLEFEKQFGNYGIFIKKTGKEKKLRATEIKEFVFFWITK